MENRDDAKRSELAKLVRLHENAMKERDDAVLGLKEVKRQYEKMRRTFGPEAIDDAFTSASAQDFEKVIAGLSAGRITADDAEAELERATELFAQTVRATDDPMMVTALDADNEAKAKQLPQIAQLLIFDAVRSAAEGATKEQWIAEVLSGHGGR